MSKAIEKNKLTPDEAKRLAELEPIVERGVVSFKEVGFALAEISDRRLYRETHSSFREYVEAKWQMAVRTAYDYIQHSEVIKSLPQECAKFAQSANPHQTRALAPVPAADRPAVIRAAAKSGKVTAKAIKSEVQKRNPKPAKAPEPEQPKKPLWLGYVNKWGRLVVKPHDMGEQLDAMQSPSVYFVIAGIEADNQAEAESIARDRIAKEQVITTIAGDQAAKAKENLGGAQPAKTNTPEVPGLNARGGEVRETPLKAERPAQSQSIEAEGLTKFAESQAERSSSPHDPEQESDLAGIIRALKGVLDALEDVEAGMLPSDELPDFNQLGNDCYSAGLHLKRIAKEIDV